MNDDDIFSAHKVVCIIKNTQGKGIHGIILLYCVFFKRNMAFFFFFPKKKKKMLNIS